MCFAVFINAFALRHVVVAVLDSNAADQIALDGGWPARFSYMRKHIIHWAFTDKEVVLFVHAKSSVTVCVMLHSGAVDVWAENVSVLLTRYDNRNSFKVFGLIMM